jgi:hypothetical protein
MRSISGWVDYKNSFVMPVCRFVWLLVCGPSCVCKSQAISTKFAMEAQNPKQRDHVRVRYQSDINFLFYAAIFDFGLLQHSIFLQRQHLSRLTDTFEISWSTSNPERL